MQNGKVISQRCDPILSKKTPRKVVYTLVPTTPSYIKYLNFLDLYYIYAYIYMDIYIYVNMVIISIYTYIYLLQTYIYMHICICMNILVHIIYNVIAVRVWIFLTVQYRCRNHFTKYIYLHLYQTHINI